MVIIILITGMSQPQQTAIVPNDACQSKTGFLPHESYCDKYYVCEDDISQVRDCPNGLVWIARGRGLKDGCGYPWDVDCSARPNRSKFLYWVYFSQQRHVRKARSLDGYFRAVVND